MIRTAKIALVGSGNIGGTMAHLASLKGLGDVALIDVAAGITQGKALDLRQASAISGGGAALKAGSSHDLMQDADVVIVTAGLARKPGMSRDDLLATNAQIIEGIGLSIRHFCPDAFVIVVTNPLDAMVWVMREACGLPHCKVVGMAGVLDSARYRFFLSEALGVCVDDISAFVLGGHGDTMVPLPRYTSVAGIPLPDLMKKGWLPQETLDLIIQRTRQGGAEIVNLLQTGSAFYAPATAALDMAEAYLKNQKRILPCAAWVNGEYGIQDTYVGVPVLIGSSGVEEVIELDLTPQEHEELHNSAAAVRGLVTQVQALRAEAAMANPFTDRDAGTAKDAVI